MLWETDYLPQFRESEANGLVGVRGYLNYFQDVASEYMYILGLGNDSLPGKYGIAWMYTKYRLQVFRQIGYGTPLHMSCWVSKATRARVWQDMEITCGGELLARGRVESCLGNLATRALCPLSAISFPDGLQLDRDVEILPFSKLRDEPIPGDPVFSHTVCYTDLDNSGHMNNLHYVELFLNALEPEFHAFHQITSFELHYISQTFYGETLHVYREMDGSTVRMTAKKSDGTTSALCLIEIAPEET